MLRMEHPALELVFRMLLTCGCPITETEERSLFDLLQAYEPDTDFEMDRVLSLFPENADTPFHRIRAFYIWQARVDSESHLITRDHIIRFFASSYHWDHAVAPGLAEGYGQVKSIASWFLSHMLLPAQVTRVGRGHVDLVYAWPGGEILLKNLFRPRSWDPGIGEVWAVHFAGLLDRLSMEEQDTASFMLEQNPALTALRPEVREIDYRDFERKGDYAGVCRKRYQAYFGE